MHEIKNIYTCIHRDTNIFTLLLFIFPTRNNQTKEKPSLFSLKSLYLLWSWRRSPSWGLDSRRQTSLFDPTYPRQFTNGTLGTCVGTFRRGKKKYSSFNLCIIHKGISFSKYLHTSSFTRFLADFSPAATGLRQTVRHRLRWYFDPVNTGSVTLFKTVTHARLWQILRGLWLRAWWSGRLGFFPP